jgi:ceramide glucosyltransferase
MQHYITWWSIREGKKEEDGLSDFTPPVSILKPLTGLEPGLKENLKAFFELNYPAYELIFCFESPVDPAIDLVDSLKEEHPNIPVKKVISDPDFGYNPKVSNVAAGLAKVDHDLILISDADIRPDKDYLRIIVQRFGDPQVGLVSNLIRGQGDNSPGSVLENLRLSFFVINGVCTLYNLINHASVVGKSMLIRKSYLEELGGLKSVRNYLAEDYIIGERMRKINKKVVISRHLITSINSGRTFRQFFNRRYRWHILRFHLSKPAYFIEPFVNPLFWSFVFMIVSLFSTLSVATFLVVGLYKIILEALQGEALHDEIKITPYLFVPLKDLLIAVVWFIPFFKYSVRWRKHRFKVKHKTELVPIQKISNT